MDIKLVVDGKDIDLNEFVSKILMGAFVGAITSLRDVDRDWKEILVKISK